MVASLILLATLATPAAAPTSTPGPLKVIATVRSSSLCSKFATHANAAIGAALQNDSTLGTLVFTLKAPDLAGNPIQRRNMLQHLSDLADDLAKQYKTGMGEIKALRGLEKQTKDPNEKTELKASADALGGALYRQHLIGRDLDGFIAYEYAADMRRPDDTDMLPEMVRANSGELVGGIYSYRPEAPTWIPQPTPLTPNMLAGHETLEEDAEMAMNASKDFASRLPAITADEVTAAGHFDQAAGGC
jgi:deoxyribodipyrimidine photolyase